TENGQSRDFMVLSEEMPEAGWTVQVLIDMAPAKTQAQLATLAGVLTIALATLGAAVLMQRRDRQRERNAFQRATLAQLEDRVRERTAELASVNRRLEGEVAERRATATELRRPPRRLNQAGNQAAPA